MSDRSPSSYRDRHSGVRFNDGVVVRSFDDEGAEWFSAVHESGLLRELQEARLVIDYTITSNDPLTIESPLLPVATFPYEWSPSMLKDAALVTLDVATKVWEAGFHLRDASAFNVVFNDGRPVFVDLGSFRPGHTPFFFAYGQFCDHFLNPLALSESRGMPTRALWWSLDGVSAHEAKTLMGRRALRPKYLRHIWARSRLERSSESLGAAERQRVRTELGLPPDAIRRAMLRLRSAVQSIEPTAGGVWESYEDTCGYGDAESEAKIEFVSRAAARSRGALAVDIGANTGRYSDTLAAHFDTVVAVEPDEAAADTLYRRVRNGDLASNITPMVMDLVDPSPGRGLMNEERSSALSRIANADLMTWLAVIHHLVLGRNVPVEMVFGLARSLSSRHVFEHVDPEDDMAQLLLSGRDEQPWPLDRPTFETLLQREFRVVERQDVTPTRRIYEVMAH